MFRMTTRIVITVLIVLGTLAACGGDEEVSLDPPEIAYGEDISEMGMFVVDPRYTVATLPDDATEWLLFDDIGELFKYRHTHRDAGFQVMWVNDFHDETWLKAEDAWYVESTAWSTPMGWGVAAFREETDARAMAAETDGTPLAWDEVNDREWTTPPSPMDHDGHAATPADVHHSTPQASPGTSPAQDDATAAANTH